MKKKNTLEENKRGMQNNQPGVHCNSLGKNNRNDDRIGGGRESEVIRRENGQNLVTDWQREKSRRAPWSTSWMVVLTVKMGNLTGEQ